EVALVAHTVDRALAYLPIAPQMRQAPLTDLLRAAAAALANSFAALSRTDASGPRPDVAALTAANEHLERFIDEDTAPPSETATLTETATATATATWVPSVDDDMLELFFAEANERLESLAQKLVELETQPGNTELIRDLFRDLHTLKGSSGLVGLRPMNQLAHAAEDLVGLLRDGKRAADRRVVDALLGALDGLRALAAP